MADTPQSELILFQNTILETLRQNSENIMSSIAFEAWFSDLHLISLDENKVVIATGKDLVKKIILTKYKDFFYNGVHEALGFDCDIEFIYDGVDIPINPHSELGKLLKKHEEEKKAAMEQEDDEEEDFGDDFVTRAMKRNQEEEQSYDAEFEDRGEMLESKGSIKDYTFDNFVVGSSNKMAYSCGKAVAEHPGEDKTFNPLFIYGPSGLGKTHLMYAIANEIHKKYPQKKIICIKSEDFLNEMLDCMGRHAMAKFRAKYRQVDVLMLDDIQFISGKQAMQLEFFHTFDALIEANKQIVVTSDRPPKEMYTLEERIQTRFIQGMIIDVQPPEYELRLAILMKKAEISNINIPTDVITFLAEKLNSNVREIEGALKKIGAVSFLSGKPITLDMVKSSIPEYFRENKPVAETVDSILEVTARKYDVSVEDILGKSRTKNIKTARNVSMYVIKTVLGLSLPAIGRMMNRDYSTVHSNIGNVEAEMAVDDKLSNEVMEIIAEIKS